MENEELKERVRELEKENARLAHELTRKVKGYGLQWIDCPEAFDVESENRIPVLEEVAEKEIKNADGKPTHVLIEGDNYHALTCLNFTHRGKIDVIYIDPPYNTGNDGFTYKDKRFLKEFPDGQQIKVDHPLRHSSWLSFMSKRLYLAKTLLSEGGVIFISIDDNEQANLKLLCDSIFGEKNFVASFIVIRSEGGGLAKQAVIGHDYLLAYARNINRFTPLRRDKDIRGDIVVKNGVKFWIETDWLRKEFGKYGTCHYEEIVSFLGDKKKAEIDEGLLKGDYVLIPKGNMHVVGRYRNVENDGSKLYTIQKFLNKSGVEDLEKYDLAELFPYPKPVSLIKEFVYGASFFKDRKNVKVLDFFAGSGTTMQAVIEANERDNGKRQCILVSNNENGICEQVTYERTRRVMCGYQNENGESIPGLGGSLKYYRTAFVGKHGCADALDEDRDELAANAGTMLALAENTMDAAPVPKKAAKFWRHYTDGAHRHTLVYQSSDYAGYPSLSAETDKIRAADAEARIVVYAYTIGGDVAQFENEFDGGLDRLELKPIPEPILEIFRSVNGD